MTKSVRAYRNSATEGATHIDILLACYDTLAGDLRMAGNAAARGSLTARCRYSQHALLLIGHMESWVSLLDDSNLAASLVSFYGYLRAEILQLQVSSEIDKFMNLALVVCETRAVWQRKQSTELSRPVAGPDTLYSTGDPDAAPSHFLVSA